MNGLEMGLAKEVIAKMLTISIADIKQIELEQKK